MKKGLAKEKNLLASRKKDLLAKQLQPQEELTAFLQSDETFDAVLAVSKDDKDILVGGQGHPHLAVIHSHSIQRK